MGFRPTAAPRRTLGIASNAVAVGQHTKVRHLFPNMFGLRKLDTPYSRCVWRGWGVWLRLVRGVYFSGVSNAGLVQTIVQTTQQSNQQKYNNEVQPGHLVALRHHVCPPLPLEWRSRDLAHPIATKRELEETADAEKVGSFLFANILQRCSVCRGLTRRPRRAN